MTPETIVPGESDHDRAKKASDLAYEKGRTDAITAATFEKHELHLKAINGSIDDGVRGLKEVRIELREVRDELRDMKSREEARDAVAKATAEAMAQQITKRTFLLGVLGTIAAMAGLFIAANPPT